MTGIVGTLFTNNHMYNHRDAYACSKWESETFSVLAELYVAHLVSIETRGVAAVWCHNRSGEFGI